LLSKHAIKQVDRLLSNEGIVVWDMYAPWVAQMVGQRTSIVVAMDWTDFDADDQATLALSLVTNHGRTTPLLWLSVLKDELKDQRNDFEDLCLARLGRVLPEGVAVTILADRGFGDTKLFDFLDTLEFAYVIRFRGNIRVSASDGETRPAAAWLYQRLRLLTHGGFRPSTFSDSLAREDSRMPASVTLRTDYSAEELRRLAKSAKSVSQGRRLLSLAAVRDGMSRADAARIGGMDRQTLRDWVHRFNEAGPEGLLDNWSKGPAPRLSAAQKEELARIVETGPDREIDGVVRWRRVDLQRVIKERFGVDYHERHVGTLLKRLGFSHVSARPRHPGQNAEIVEAYKKTSHRR
jgi:transposase